jgi:hypothetical protein
MCVSIISLFFVVKQHNPFNKQWHTISNYNESGNFLGPAFFETKQEAQEYLELYERKLLLQLISVNSNTKSHKKSNNNDNDNDDNKKRKAGRRRRNEYVELKVFQESMLPPINKPSFFHKSN